MPNLRPGSLSFCNDSSEGLLVPYLRRSCRSLQFGGSRASMCSLVFWPFKLPSLCWHCFVCHLGADWEMLCGLIGHVPCGPYFLREQNSWKWSTRLGPLPSSFLSQGMELWGRRSIVSESQVYESQILMPIWKWPESVSVLILAIS